MKHKPVLVILFVALLILFFSISSIPARSSSLGQQPTQPCEVDQSCNQEPPPPIPCEQDPQNPCTQVPPPPIPCEQDPQNPCTLVPPQPTRTCQQLQNCTPVPPQPIKTCQQLQNCTPTPSPTSVGTETATSSPSPTTTPVPSSTFTPAASLTATRVLPTAIVAPTLKPGFLDKIFSFIIPSPTPTPTPSILDLELVKVEIVQAVQCIDNPACKDNSTPLFSGKPTMVRAYVRIKTGPESVPNISGMLCNQTDTSLPTDCIRPVSPITVYKVGDPVAVWRGDIRYTMNFILPATWTSKPGWQHFLTQVNYKMENVPECPEWSCERNNMSYNSAFVMASRPLNVVFVQIKYNGIWPGESPKWNIVDWVKRVYPTSNIAVWEIPVGIVTRANLNEKPSDSKMGGGWTDLLDELAWLKDNTTNGGDKYFYGMVSSSAGPIFASGAGRWTDSPPVVAAGVVGNPGRRDGEDAAHEFGHNMDRAHTPGCGTARPDPGYPFALGDLDDTGIDILLNQVYKNNMSSDIMSYCGSEWDTWISSYTYRALIARMGYPAYGYEPGEKVLASPRSVEPVDYLVGSGYISPSSIDLRQGFYKLSLEPDPAHNFTSGPYSAELQDAAGKTLSSVSFLPAREDNEISETGSFHIRIPWADGVTTIVFKYNGAEIGRKQASSGSPSVTLLWPNGGDNWGPDGTQTIFWAGSDPDGDKLTYIVNYSRDNGASWETLAANVEDTQWVLDDVSGFAGSQAALIKVTATDGFNTAMDVSDQPFSVAGKGPEVFISSPAQGLSAPFGSAIILSSMGTDPEDGPLAETAFNWSSNRDGALGSGSLLINQTLSVGEHIITLAGTDTAGNAATQSVTIVITPVENPVVQTKVNTSPQPWLLWLILVLAILLLAGLVIMLLGKRRKRA